MAIFYFLRNKAYLSRLFVSFFWGVKSSSEASSQSIVVSSNVGFLACGTSYWSSFSVILFFFAVVDMPTAIHFARRQYLQRCLFLISTTEFFSQAQFKLAKDLLQRKKNSLQDGMWWRHCICHDLLPHTPGTVASAMRRQWSIPLDGFPVAGDPRF